MINFEDIIDGLKEERGRNYENAAKALYKYFSQKKTEKPGSDFIYTLKYEGVEEAYNDAIKDIIVSIHKNDFKGNASINTYFYRIFKNKLINAYNQEKKKGFIQVDSNIEGVILQEIRINEIEGLLGNVVSAEFSLIEQEESIKNETLKNAIQQCFEQMQKDCTGRNKKACCNEVLILWSNGYKHQEIADKLELPHGSISTKISGCLNKVQHFFHQKGLL